MRDLDDLTALRELRADVPTPNAAQLAGARWKLMAAASEEARGGPEHGRPGRTPARRATRRAAIAAVSAAALTVGVLVASDGVSGSRSPRTNTVAYVLDAAAKKAEKGSVSLPGPKQWVVLETVSCMPQCFTRAEWVRGDGKSMASARVDANGRIEPLTTHKVMSERNNPIEIYTSLSRLPTEPHALLTQLRTDPSFRWTLPYAGVADSTKHRPGTPLDQVTPTLDDAAGMIFVILEAAPILPPQVNAALFRALKLIPNARLVPTAQDGLDRQGLGVQLTGKQFDMRRTLVLDPKTYAYLGHRMQWQGAKYFDYASARKASGIVDRPGQLPRVGSASPSE
ncbi:CU044_5270 family protein [Streptomyces sp. NPDC051662]|uniref:CU044_5270 family protein n=1 Tax=Streptomyces sp. NPDC051662 TaxID=3154750 RepID=UPI0034326112